MHTVTVERTIEKIPGGGCLLTLAATAAGGFADSGVFILRDVRTMLNARDIPSFETIADPCLLSELTLDEPEWPGHFYRASEVQLQFPSQGECATFLLKMDSALASLCKNMDVVTDDSNLVTEERVIDGHTVVLKTTKGNGAYRKVVILLDTDDKQLIMEDGGAAGTLFKDICPFNDISSLGEVPDAPEGWRTHTVALITYAGTVDLLKAGVLNKLQG